MWPAINSTGQGVESAFRAEFEVKKTSRPKVDLESPQRTAKISRHPHSTMVATSRNVQGRLVELIQVVPFPF